jgi:hypothetical protein
MIGAMRLRGAGPHSPVRPVSAESDAGIVPPMALYDSALRTPLAFVALRASPARPARRYSAGTPSVLPCAVINSTSAERYFAAKRKHGTAR